MEQTKQLHCLWLPVDHGDEKKANENDFISVLMWRPFGDPSSPCFGTGGAFGTPLTASTFGAHSRAPGGNCPSCPLVTPLYTAIILDLQA